MTGTLGAEGEFLFIPDAPVLVRDRRAALSLTLRKPEMLPPQEIRGAITASIGSSFGGAEEEVVQAVASRFGFQVKSATLRHAILQQTDTL